MVTTDEILKKYGAKIEAELSSWNKSGSSSEYKEFKREMLKEQTKYERLAKSLGNMIKLKIADRDRLKMQRYLDIARVDITPNQIISLSIITMFLVFFLTIAISFIIFIINQSFPILFLLLGLIASLFIFYYFYTMPKRLANAWRLKASSQMVPAILYVVIYMKHTSNLEKAIEFASQHLEGPLSLDFRKIFYDVEIGKYSSIKQSLDAYLETWKDYAPEFIESFHLIESSLYEPSDSRRTLILEKSLQVMLDGVYEKMLRYSREIRSPLTNIYMLGIILPTLMLALLPLASTLLGGAIQWQHVFIIFNLIIPFFVYYLTSEVLLKRPGGYGESSILELNPYYPAYKSNKPWIKAFLICLPLFIIGIIPFLFQVKIFTNLLGLENDYAFSSLGLSRFGDMKIFDFKIIGSGRITGPFGPLAVILSLFIPLSIALFFSLAYQEKTKSLIKARENTKILEMEFTNSLFHLGNRIGDGLPAEIAFARVAESTQGQKTYEFFSIVNKNIQQMGMSLERAIFDKNKGAIIYFPSSLISTSMRILVESVKKGLQIAAQSLMSISEYVKNIEKVNQRLKDILAEIVSDMKSNMTFLAPLLSGIVAGLSVMITSILNKLQSISDIAGTEVSGLGSLTNIVQIFKVNEMISPYFLQISIGIYIIEIIFILTIALVTVDSGKDTLKEKYDLSKNLKAGILLYTITALISIITLTLIASIALGGIS